MIYDSEFERVVNLPDLAVLLVSVAGSLSPQVLSISTEPSPSVTWSGRFRSRSKILGVVGSKVHL